MSSTVERQTITLPSATLSVLAAGTPTAGTILLLHGIPASAELFRDVLARLAEAGYRALAPDMPGYGASRFADDMDYSLSAVADLYGQWLQEAELGSVWLVGHDLGGAVAQMLIVRYPHLFSHFTLGNAPIADSFPVAAINQMKAIAQLGLWPLLSRLRLIPNPIIVAELRRGFANPAKLTTEMQQRIFWDGKVDDARGRREFVKHLRHLRNDESIAIAPRLKEVAVPSLLLWGGADPFQALETTGKRLHDALPAHTALEVVPGTGHFFPAEDPEAYVRGLLHWRETV